MLVSGGGGNKVGGGGEGDGEPQNRSQNAIRLKTTNLTLNNLLENTNTASLINNNKTFGSISNRTLEKQKFNNFNLQQ